MSTTNPPPAGQPPTDDHDAAGPPPDAVIKRGYEEDRYDSTSVISVPILVIVFFVLAFSTVTVIFRAIRNTPDDPNANPMLVEDHNRPLNERLEDIHRGGKVDQPRLEPLKLRSGDARAITRPPEEQGNSPELHADDLWPSPERTPALYNAGWIEKDKVARLALDDAMKAAASGKLTSLFGAQKPATELPTPTELPTAANAGRGHLPGTMPKPEGKDGKKENGKKEEKH